MLIEIDFYLLIKFKVTAHQYVICYLLHKKAYEDLNIYLTAYDFKSFEYDVNYLISLGLVERYDYATTLDIKGYFVTEKGLELLSEKEMDFFDELISVYPNKVIRPNGITDYLKLGIPGCRSAYKRIVKNKVHLHEHILKCLKNELYQRTIANNMAYMKRLSKWLENEEWRSFEDSINDNTEVKVKSYGTQLE
jgi:hypothetical protein